VDEHVSVVVRVSGDGLSAALGDVCPSAEIGTKLCRLLGTPDESTRRIR
jgi:hypothetical protein